jgi:hypothetical protein
MPGPVRVALVTEAVQLPNSATELHFEGSTLPHVYVHLSIDLSLPFPFNNDADPWRTKRGGLHGSLCAQPLHLSSLVFALV